MKTLKTIYDVRRDNLKMLSKQKGGLSQLAILLHRSKSQMSNIIGKNPKRNIGDANARQFEKFLKLARGFLDQDHTNPHRIYVPIQDPKGLIKYPSKGEAFFIPFLGLDYRCDLGLNVEAKEELMISSKLIETTGIDPLHSVFIEAEGEAMDPTIRAGDFLLIDQRKNSFEQIENREKYLVRLGKETLSARLFKEAEDQIRLSFDNTNTKIKYPDKIVNKNDPFQILGKIVQVSTTH